MILKNKIALVTGAGSGFGEGMASMFAKEGATVYLADSNYDAACKVSDSINQNGNKAFPIHCDVSDHSQVIRMVENVVNNDDRLDIVVNNAGITHKNCPLLEVTEKEYDAVFSVNVKSCYLLALSIVPIFRKQGTGCILNIASVAGLRPRPGLTWYCASKGALITMTKAMAIELAEDNIRVNAICPVAGDTPLLSRFLKEDTLSGREAMLESIPLGRFCTPDDVARAAVFLVSEQSSLITGSILEVDGGRGI